MTWKSKILGLIGTVGLALSPQADAAQSHPFSIDDVMMGGAGTALVREGFNSNPAAYSFLDEKLEFDVPNLIIWSDGEPTQTIEDVIDRIDFFKELRDIEEDMDVVNRVLDASKKERSSFEIGASIAPLFRFGKLIVSPYVIAQSSSTIEAPHGMDEVDINMISLDELELLVGDQGVLLHMNTNIDSGLSLSFGHTFDFGKGFGLGLSLTNRVFYREECDLIYSLPQRVLSGVDNLEETLSVNLSGAKKGWGFGLDAAGLLKLSDYTSVGFVANNLSNTSNSLHKDILQLDLGVAFRPLAFHDKFNDFALAFDVANVTGHRVYEFGVQAPVPYSKDIVLVPRIGFNSDFVKSLRGNQISAGFSLKVFNWVTNVGYVCHFSRGYEDKEFPAAHMGLLGFTYKGKLF